MRLLATFLSAALGLGGALVDAAAPTHVILEHGGLTREAYVYVPEGRPTRLVLVLHGGAGRAKHMARRLDRGRMVRLAARDRALLVFPQGYERSWNDGRGVEHVPAQAAGVDDVGFLRSLVEELTRRYRVPEGEVFATGISNGGFMCFRLACEAPDLVKAVAPVTATLPRNLAGRLPAKPVGMLVLNGTEDPLVPYEGGHVQLFRRKRGAILSTAESLALFAEANGCDADPVETDLADADPSDGIRSTVTRHRGCDEAGPTGLVTIHGGGHTWPGGVQYLPRFLIGPVTRDFHASDLIWEFFSEL